MRLYMKKQTLLLGLFLLGPLLLTACGNKNVDACDPSKFDCTPVCDKTKFDCTPKNEIASSAAVVDDDKANIAKPETENLNRDKLTTEEKKEAPAVVKPEEVKKMQSAKKQDESDTFQKSFDDSRDFEIGGSAQNVLLFLQKTKNPNIFIAYKEGANGVFTKTGNKGVFEYYIDGKYMVEEYLF